MDLGHGFGFFDPVTSVVTYDAEADAWATAPALPWPPSRGCTATTMDGGILFLYHGPHGRVLQHKDGVWSETAEVGLAKDASVCGSVLLG